MKTFVPRVGHGPHPCPAVLGEREASREQNIGSVLSAVDPTRTEENLQCQLVSSESPTADPVVVLQSGTDFVVHRPAVLELENSETRVP